MEATLAPLHSTPAAPQRLPFCIPVGYRGTDGVHRLAYPRSPWHPARYLVASTSPAVPDLECVHDDMGHLVPVRSRSLTGDWTSQMAWRPVAGAVARGLALAAGTHAAPGGAA